MKLRPLYLIAVLSLLVSACSTPIYREASSGSAFGYSDAPLEDNRYRVTFRGRNINIVYDFALLRAAEVTLASNNTWFKVTNSFTGEEERLAGSSVTLGAGHSSWGGHSGYGFGFGFPLVDSRREAVQTLDIIVGGAAPDDEKPEGDNVYDAAEVMASVGPRTRREIGSKADPKAEYEG
jgi:hypothetical protein